jgi:hypothetical protein
MPRTPQNLKTTKYKTVIMSIEFSGEPKKYFVNKLIFMTTDIEQRIYLGGMSTTQTLSALEGIIAILKPADKEALKNTIATIHKYQDRVNQVKTRQLRNLFSNLMDYLHTGWLKELGARPKFSKKGHLKVN